MTTDSLDQLRDLTNLSKLEENQRKSDIRRPTNRPILEHFEADVKVSGPHMVSGKRKEDDSEWTREVVRLSLSNIVVYKASEPFYDATFDLDVGLSDKLGSSLGQMVATLKELDPTASSIADFDGRRVTFQDDVYLLGWDRKFTRRDGTEGSEPASVWFYRPLEVSKVAGKVAVAIPALSEDAATAFCVGKSAESLTSGDGIKEFLTFVTGLAEKSPELQSQVVGRRFVSRMVAEKKLAEVEGILQLV